MIQSAIEKCILNVVPLLMIIVYTIFFFWVLFWWKAYQFSIFSWTTPFPCSLIHTFSLSHFEAHTRTWQRYISTFKMVMGENIHNLFNSQKYTKKSRKTSSKLPWDYNDMISIHWYTMLKTFFAKMIDMTNHLQMTREWNA